MNFEQIHSVQSWLPIDEIIDKGIIKLKDTSYIKIIGVKPINYNLKSDLEKRAILNSYKNIFKSCNFNLQILIQSKKEDLTNNIKIIRKNDKYLEYREKYIKEIKELNQKRKSSKKSFYLIIKENPSEKSINTIINNLQNNYLKVKDLLLKCGNYVSEYTDDKQVIEILFSLLNSKTV